MIYHKFARIVLISLTLFFSSCVSKEPLGPTLTIPTGQKLSLRVFTDQATQLKGLSGLRPDEFSPQEAALFFYSRDATRSFWMVDTYFDLDIFFLDEDFRVLSVARNMPAHPGRKTPPQIASTGEHFCRHVLEIRSDSPLAKKISTGDQLSFENP